MLPKFCKPCIKSIDNAVNPVETSRPPGFFKPVGNNEKNHCNLGQFF